MSCGNEVFRPPPDSPDQSCRTGKKENPSPGCEGEDDRNEWRCNDCTNRRSRIHDAHSERALANGKPFVHSFGSSREAAAFTHSKKEPAHRKHPEARRESVARTR